eukprot:TRINITY_DN3185_c0_g1_i1.p1 TRINITY_DN3185_c0_g1~~TRINITY_DN3185_c0_g1_i1.p1  ORF type:complete len:272 (-),score=63.41 TRINITY_DN3185_c0_g1_i1:929-1744(-)
MRTNYTPEEVQSFYSQRKLDLQRQQIENIEKKRLQREKYEKYQASGEPVPKRRKKAPKNDSNNNTNCLDVSDKPTENQTVEENQLLAKEQTQKPTNTLQSSLPELLVKQIGNVPIFSYGSYTINLMNPNPNDETSSTSIKSIEFKDRKSIERFLVFQDLWEKNYYITEGSKFGGDFLLYPNEPSNFHASHIVVVLNETEEKMVEEIIAMVRCSVTVKKKLIIATVKFQNNSTNENNKELFNNLSKTFDNERNTITTNSVVNYMSIDWLGVT